jgi:hypothetical protein
MVKVTFVVYFSVTSINISQQDQLCNLHANRVSRIQSDEKCTYNKQ